MKHSDEVAARMLQVGMAVERLGDSEITTSLWQLSGEADLCMDATCAALLRLVATGIVQTEPSLCGVNAHTPFELRVSWRRFAEEVFQVPLWM